MDFVLTRKITALTVTMELTKKKLNTSSSVLTALGVMIRITVCSQLSPMSFAVVSQEALSFSRVPLISRYGEEKKWTILQMIRIPKLLCRAGRKHFQELIDQHTQISVQVNGIDLNLSDIIAARERLTGEYVTAEINRIIWKCNDQRAYQTETFEYSTNVRTHSVESEGKA